MTENWAQESQSNRAAGALSILILCKVKLDYGCMGEIHPEANIEVQGSGIRVAGIPEKTFASVEEAGDEACRYAVERHDRK
jgi:hypothetical protein